MLYKLPQFCIITNLLKWDRVGGCLHVHSSHMNLTTEVLILFNAFIKTYWREIFQTVQTIHSSLISYLMNIHEFTHFFVKYCLHL